MNLAQYRALQESARQLGNHRTKKEVVIAALIEYIQRQKQLRIFALFGTIDFDHTFNYKAERRKKR